LVEILAGFFARSVEWQRLQQVLSALGQAEALGAELIEESFATSLGRRGHPASPTGQGAEYEKKPVTT